MNSRRKSELSVSRLFADGVVLQRRTAIPVWGKAADGTEVAVELNGRTQTTEAKAGRWSVRLDPMEAGGPFELRITGGGCEIAVRDVLIGEVWVAGGQSNIGYSFREIGGVFAEGACEELNGSHASIRLFKAAEQACDSPGEDLTGGTWKRLSAEALPALAAIPVYFAIELERRLGVPIGIVQLSRAGTKASCWVPRRLAARPEHAYLLAEEAAERERLGAEHPHRPFALYNGTVAPARSFAIRGFVWYQGESDALEGKADRYGKLFPALIDAWREDWGCPQAPFLFVQLPGYDAGTEQWPIVRDAQLRAVRQVPRTAMAVTIDLPESEDLHPKKKRPVADRLALLAFGIAYGDTAIGGGPLYESAERVEAGVAVKFDVAGSELAVRDGGRLTGFELCGQDGAWLPAEAAIIGPCTVVVRCADIAGPSRVRYGWSAAPRVRLTNSEGLPASPFLSDWIEAKG